MTSKKHRKSLTMSDKLFTDMNNLCDVLGINSHSYILNLVAKEVHRDMVNLHLRAPSSDCISEKIAIESNYTPDEPTNEFINIDIDSNGNKRAF